MNHVLLQLAAKHKLMFWTWSCSVLHISFPSQPRVPYRRISAWLQNRRKEDLQSSLVRTTGQDSDVHVGRQRDGNTKRASPPVRWEEKATDSDTYMRVEGKTGGVARQGLDWNQYPAVTSWPRHYQTLLCVWRWSLALSFKMKHQPHFKKDSVLWLKDTFTRIRLNLDDVLEREHVPWT